MSILSPQKQGLEIPVVGGVSKAKNVKEICEEREGGGGLGKIHFCGVGMDNLLNSTVYY